MLESVARFADYFDRVRERTLRMLAAVPADRMAYAPRPGKFTLGDLVRHIGSAEAMFVEAVLDGGWRYRGHHSALRETLEEALSYLEETHSACMARLRAAPDSLLAVKRDTLKGHPVSAWHLLMAMVEHEVHHRAKVAQYLVSLGLQPPQIFGLRIEQVPGPEDG